MILICDLREWRRFKHKRSNKSKMVFHVNGKVVVGKNETWNPKFLNQDLMEKVVGKGALLPRTVCSCCNLLEFSWL